ncbi:MAG: hypothetical protein JWN78_1081 [Bacteroidota bacterium]|nr:hypothetical protein [Bacteroidota bacterium]
MKKSVFILLLACAVFPSKNFAQRQLSINACEGSERQDEMIPIYTRSNMLDRMYHAKPDAKTHYMYYNSDDSSWYSTVGWNYPWGSGDSSGVWLVKTDKKNNVIRRSYLPSSDSAFNVVIDKTGIYLSDYVTFYVNPGQPKIFKILRYDFEGRLLWEHRILSYNNLMYISGIHDDGGIDVIFDSHGGSMPNYFEVARLNGSDGTEIYNHSFSRVINSNPTPLKFAARGNYLYSYGSFSLKANIQKINLQTGALEKQKTIDTVTIDFLQPMDSNIILLGSYYFDYDGWGMTLDNDLNIIERDTFTPFVGNNYVIFDSIENCFYGSLAAGNTFIKIGLHSNVFWKRSVPYGYSDYTVTFRNSAGNIVRFVNELNGVPWGESYIDVINKNTGDILYTHYTDDTHPDSVVFSGKAYYATNILVRQSPSNPDEFYILKEYYEYSSDYPPFFHVLEKFNSTTGKISREELQKDSSAVLVTNIETGMDEHILVNGNMPCNYGNKDVYWGEVLDSTNIISGKVYIDVNNNNVYDAATDYLYTQGAIKTGKTNYVYSAYLQNNGTYAVNTDTGMYTSVFTGYNSYFIVTPVSKIISHDTYGNHDTVDFILHPAATIHDLSVTLANSWVTRPGFINSYEAFYINNGTAAANANIVIVLDHRLSYESAVPAPFSIHGDTLSWNIGSLNPSMQGQITVSFTADVPPLLNGNDTLYTTAIISSVSEDTMQADNIFRLTDVARNSFDPNDKDVEANLSMTPSQISNGEYITYRIRFQNTGNFTATNIRIRDTLENNLDWNSLQIIGASHSGLQTTIINNNIVEFRFDNINLLPVSQDPDLSHGFVVYKVKPKSSLIAGNTIKNTAHIIFDYNQPVNTNTALVSVVNLTGTISHHNVAGDIKVFPNPGDGQFTVDFSSKGNFPLNITIYDLTGEIVYMKTLHHIDRSQIEISETVLASGLYNIQLYGNNQTWNKKIMINKP